MPLSQEHLQTVVTSELVMADGDGDVTTVEVVISISDNTEVVLSGNADVVNIKVVKSDVIKIDVGFVVLRHVSVLNTTLERM